MGEESMKGKAKSVTKQLSIDLIPKLNGKKVVIRLVSGGQPITGTIKAFNPYEILLQTTKGQLLVFKHAIATIEMVGVSGGYKQDR